MQGGATLHELVFHVECLDLLKSSGESFSHVRTASVTYRTNINLKSYLTFFLTHMH